MSIVRAFVAFAVALPLLVACDSGSGPARGTTAEQVKKEAGEAVTVTKQYLDERRAQVVEGLKEKLRQVDAKIAELKERASKETGAAKEKLDRAAASLQQERDALAKKLDEAKAATTDTWRSFESGVQSAIDRLDEKVTSLTR